MSRCVYIFLTTWLLGIGIVVPQMIKWEGFSGLFCLVFVYVSCFRNLVPFSDGIIALACFSLDESLSADTLVIINQRKKSNMAAFYKGPPTTRKA